MHLHFPKGQSRRPATELTRHRQNTTCLRHRQSHCEGFLISNCTITERWGETTKRWENGEPLASEGSRYKCLHGTLRARLNQPRAPEKADGKHEDGGEQRENSVYGNSSDAERQQNEPDKWISDEREQGQRPAHHEQEAPENQGDHGGVS